MIELIYEVEGKRIDTLSSDDNMILRSRFTRGRRIVTVRAINKISLIRATEEQPREFDKDDLIMANGYQSWTETKEFSRHEYINVLKAIPEKMISEYHLLSYGAQAFWTENSHRHTGFDFSYIKGKHPLFIGSYNIRNAYLQIRFMEHAGMIILESDVYGKELEPGEEFTLFDYVICEDGKEYFDSFTPVSDEKLIGYSSWYNYYQDINEERISTAVETIDDRFQLFQIDDGYETYVGDWFDVDRNKFPNGLEPIVEKIHKRGMKAGIWMAPLVAEKDSAVFREHPEWIAKDENGKVIYAGNNWSDFSPLDLTVPEAVQYIKDSLRHYSDMGFDFFKLDFLYAVNLARLPGMTRCETSEYAYSMIRECLRDKLILGCGATLSNGFSRFDYMRVGADVSLLFDGWPQSKFLHPERVSTKHTIQNTIYRSCLDGHMFLNDPDVFLMRSDNMKMSFGQRAALTTINSLFGSLFMTSDNIAEYDIPKMSVLEHALDLFRNGKVLSYTKRGKYIDIEYECHGISQRFTYNTEKGIITDKVK
ncbi:MAG: alpha-galactosidase [Eubacterium sp.]|nr:alpha-galactosidase [Eubacterium sp.]